MNNIVDFTKMKPSKKYHLVTCPKCGLVGELHKYINGSACINHKGHRELCFFKIDNYCFFNDDERKQINAIV